MISCGREGWKIEEKNLQVSVWRVAAVQKVRANNPHATLDSLVARFRQLRPDLVRISRVYAEGRVSDLPNQVPQHTAPQAKNAKQGSTSLHKRFHKVCHLFPFQHHQLYVLRFGKTAWTCADQLSRLQEFGRVVNMSLQFKRTRSRH